jgi:hypothetical protein
MVSRRYVVIECARCKVGTYKASSCFVDLRRKHMFKANFHLPQRDQWSLDTAAICANAQSPGRSLLMRAR